MATQIRQGQLNNNGGWTPALESWSYASASTITVPSGAASKYSIGDRIRLKQGGGYKYYVLTAVADTLLTVLVNTDYTVANSAITDNDYSHEVSPVGYPHWFNVAAPNFDVSTFDNGSGGQPTTTTHRVNIVGRALKAKWAGAGTKGASSSGSPSNIQFSANSYSVVPVNVSAQTVLGTFYQDGTAAGRTGSVIAVGSTNYAIFSTTVADNTAINDASYYLEYEI